MVSRYHKKIQAILKEANLPKDLSEEIKRELESHFYEKVCDLQFKGFKSTDIEQKVCEDFGSSTLVAKQFELLHKFNLKNLMKKLFFGSFIFVLILVFFAPWLWYDNGEDVLENSFFSGKEDQNFNKPLDRIPVVMGENLILSDSEKMCYCDGSCMRVEWAPFGVTVKACAEDYYYVSFWGQQFHINGK